MENCITTNTIEIIGTLAESKLEVKQNKNNGSDFICGDIVIQAELDGAINTFEIGFYAKKVTNSGEISKLYTAYEGIDALVGKKVRVSGSLREERYFDKTTGQMRSLQKLNGKFINGEQDAAIDKAEFDFGGFVRKGLTAKVNKANEVYAYELEVGQANWDNTIMNCYKFQVDPSRVEIINAIKKLYSVNSTVSFGGNLRFIVTSNEVKTESAFGESKVRVYTNTIRNYYITRGDEPIIGEGMYAADDIAQLVKAYAEKDVEKTSEAGASAAPVGRAPISSRQTSLI